MGAVACNRGCFVCGPVGQRWDHFSECCGSTECDSYRWEMQVEKWLEVEKDYIERWCAAEEEYKRALRSKEKVHVKHVPKPSNEPSQQRDAAKRRKQTAQ